MTEEKLHPINVVVRRTGLSVHVIRAWEKRYRAVAPARTKTNRRLYSDADIHRLRLLRQAVLAGRSIGQIAHLPSEKLLRLIDTDEATKSLSQPVETSLQETSEQSLLAHCLAAVERFDPEALSEALSRSSISLGQIIAIDEVVAPLMREIGNSWHEGSLRILHEHMAAGVVRTYLGNALEGYDRAETSPAAVSAAPSREMHELGALACAVAAAAEGWRVAYLGPNMPAEEIIKASELIKARAIMLSITSPMDEQRTQADLRRLRRLLDESVAIIIGGNASGRYPELLNTEGIVMGKNMKELRDILSRLWSGISIE